MNKEKSFRKEKLPQYIEHLKGVILKDLDIMTKEVIEDDIDSDKFYNLVKARRMAAEDAAFLFRKINLLLKDLEGIGGEEISSYYRENIPLLIDSIKEMYILDLNVLNLDNDDTEAIKLHNLIKSRKVAAEDCEWALFKIEELESELNTKEEDFKNQSWAKRAAKKNR